MSKTKFTPGPWKSTTEDIGDDDFIDVPWEIFGPNGERVVSADGGLYSWDARPREQFEADARLIVKSPKLYEVLREFVESSEHVRSAGVVYSSESVLLAAIAVLAEIDGGRTS